MNDNNKGYYKKYQCRYFDDDGNSLTPACRQGDNCRFVHPTDPNWPGKKYGTTFHKFSNHNNSSSQRRQSGNSDCHHFKSRGDTSTPPRGRKPLPPQSDLFGRQFKQEDVEDSTSLLERLNNEDRRSERGLQCGTPRAPPDGPSALRRQSPPRGPSPLQNHSSPLRVTKTDLQTEKMDRSSNAFSRPFQPAAQEKSGIQHHRSPQNSLSHHVTPHPSIFSLKNISSQNGIPVPPATPSTVSLGQPASQPATNPIASQASHAMQRNDTTENPTAAHDIVELFRGLAKISSDVFEMTSEYDRQEKKLKTYTEISATLSKVSNSAAASVAPNLAEILLNHAQTQSRLDHGLNTLGQVWEEVFGRVGQEVSAAIDQAVEHAKTRLKSEAEHAVKMALLKHAPNTRERERDPTPKRPRDYCEEETVEKRRRTSDWDTRAQPSAPTSASADDALLKMQRMLEQQLASIQQLTKENVELKYNLHPVKAPPTGPSLLRRESSGFQNNDVNGSRPRYHRDEPTEGSTKFGPESGSSRDYSHSRHERSYSNLNREHEEPRGRFNDSWERRSASPGHYPDTNGGRR